MSDLTLGLETVVTQCEESLSTDIEGEVVMINLETSSYYGLNVVGSRIWTLIAQPVTIGDLCTTLQQEYDVDAETCRNEVNALLREVIGEQLVRIVPR